MYTTGNAASTTGTTAGGSDGPGELAIEAPEVSPNDEPITVRVTGAAPGETVAFAATMTDDDGVEWRSEATFTADAVGVVDLTDRAPESGTYEGVEPMGWLWSMETDADAWLPTLAAEPRVSIELAATAGDRRTERTIERELYDAGIESRPVDREDLAGTLYVPPGEGPHPGVLDLHGSGGRMGEGTARLLATHGLATLAVTYHGEADAVPDEHRSIPLSYFDRAATWIRERPEVRDGNVGLVGVSRGAELALVLGARFEWVGAVVSYAGSGVAWDTPSGEPGWIDDGEAVPHLEGKDTPGETVAAGLEDEPVAEATPAVEETRGPILLLSGGDDEVWPSRRLSEIVVERLEREGFEYAFEHRTYDGVGHFIGRPYVPLPAETPTGGTRESTVRAGEDSWPVVLEYLERGLDAGGD